MNLKMNLGDRMKMIEGIESSRIFLPGLPICIRLDGRAFHTFSKGLKRPYDENFRNLMVETTKELVKETDACVGYTQSDEISLVLYAADPKTNLYFDGRIQKIVSMTASVCSVAFNKLLPAYLPEKVKSTAYFDCRAWVVPSLDDATNTLLWREKDCTKNSISSAAQANFSHKSLMGLNSSQLQNKLWQEAKINWNDYPSEFKRGVYVARRRVDKAFTDFELESLPKNHNARKDPSAIYSRVEVVKLDLPPLSTIDNRVSVLFRGEDPQ